MLISELPDLLLEPEANPQPTVASPRGFSVPIPHQPLLEEDPPLSENSDEPPVRWSPDVGADEKLEDEWLGGGRGLYCYGDAVSQRHSVDVVDET
jgi:hypothetical protein